MAEKTKIDFSTTPFGIGIKGKCPRCREGSIFSGYLKLASHCPHCGLDMSFADPADGPAFFTMSIVSFPLTGFAVWQEMVFQAPYWVHLFTTLPVTVLSVLALLRPLKGWLVCAQYMNKAEQGRLDEGGDEGGQG